MKTEVAQQISDEMNAILVRLNESVRIVMVNSDAVEFEDYRLAVAHIMAAVVDLTNALHSNHPHVKPQGHDDETAD